MRKHKVIICLTIFALLLSLSSCAKKNEELPFTENSELSTGLPEETSIVYEEDLPPETETLAPALDFCDTEWADIILACQNRDFPANWQVGDTKTMVIDGVEYNIMIIGKYHDSYADGSGKAPLTFQLVECYQTLAQMDPNMSTGACWQECAMRTTTLPQILELMPVKDAIKEVNKVTRKKDNSGVEIVVDKLFLLSQYEVYGNSVACEEEGKQYEYYAEGGKRVKEYNGPDDCWWYDYENVGPCWWLRSHSADYGNGFATVYGDGQRYGDYSDWYDGVAFAFCF